MPDSLGLIMWGFIFLGSYIAGSEIIYPLYRYITRRILERLT